MRPVPFDPRNPGAGARVRRFAQVSPGTPTPTAADARAAIITALASLGMNTDGIGPDVPLSFLTSALAAAAKLAGPPDGAPAASSVQTFANKVRGTYLRAMDPKRRERMLSASPAGQALLRREAAAKRK